MLRVVPKAWSYAFCIMDGTETVAQTVDLSWWRDRGELRVGEASYTARREKSSYVLESAAGVLARATRKRRWSHEFAIAHAGRQYTLRQRSAFRNQYLLLEGTSEVGSISPEGLFTRKASVDLPRALPLFLQVFVVWLVMTLWKHADSTAA
jgi:hypothetical protein